ncbi:MAG: HAD family phosphatase [Oscillospiraceae bacterium]
MNTNFTALLQSHNIKGSIFDMDGTILDSSAAWKDLSRNMLKSMGIMPKDDLEYNLKSMSSGKIPQYLCETYGLACSPSEVRAIAMRVVEDKYRFDLLLKPHVREFLTALRSNEITSCIATANQRSLAFAAMNREAVIDSFKFIITGEDVGNAGKDDPVIFLQAAKLLGVVPNECIVFEDTWRCIITAKEAGFVVIGVEDPAAIAYKQDIINASDYYITSFLELL